MKAMILAAGRGERLKPLTDSLPKPLVQAGSHCLIEYHLLKLAQSGIRDVVINVSHLKDLIMARLGDGRAYGLNIHYSIEEPAPLETGGGIFQALQKGLLGDDPFLLLSADVWSEYPFENFPKNLKDDAYLVMVENPNFRPQGDFGLVDGRVINQQPFYTYASLGVLHPRIFAACQSGFFKLAPLLMKSIQAGRVSGELYQGPWFNIGTINELNQLKEYLGSDHENN